jgi:O-antigen ligase
MSSLSLKNNILISLLFAVFLISSVNIEHGMGISAILTLLVSVVGLIVTRKQDYPSLQTWEKYWISALFFFVSLIYIDILRDFGDISDIDSQSRLLLAIPVYLYVRRVGVNLDIVLIGAAIGGIFSGVIAWYEYYYLSYSMAEGVAGSHIYFGEIALLLSIFSVFGLTTVKGYSIKLLLVVGFIFGGYAMLISGSRGGWITLPTILILFMSYNIWNIALWKRLLGSIMVVVILFSAYHSPELPVKQRVDLAINEVVSYYSDSEMSSIGYRLEMWKASYLSAKDGNFLGNGENGYRSEVKRLVQEGRVDKSLIRFVDPHSQYFNTLLDQGVIGVLSLLLIFFIPLKVLFNNLKNQKQSHVSAMFSSIILLSFMEFMITVSTLEIQIMSLFFAFTLSIFLGLFTHNRHYS